MKRSKEKPKINWKKLLTEASLWLLFLFVCGLIGFGQGLKPRFKVTDYVVGPAEIHILTISEHFFPTESIQEIENSTHTKIIISTIQNWDQLKVQLIATPSPEIIFIPQHWAQALKKEELLSTNPDFKNNFGQSLASDFSAESQFFLPVYWAKLSIMNTTDKDKSLAFLNDPDLFVSYAENSNESKQDEFFLKHAFQITNMDLWFKDAVSENSDLILSTHILSSKKPNWKKTSYPDSFYVLGFSLSKNNPHVKQSLAVLDYYTSLELQTHLLESIPFASTLNSINESSLPNEIKSSFLRTLDFNKLIILKNKETTATTKARKLTAAYSF